MIKQKDDKKVEEWSDPKSGFSTVIYLRYTEFVATLLEREFKAPDIGKLRCMLKDYATHWLTMEWHPIIEIELTKERSSSYGYGRRSIKTSERKDAAIQVEIKRYYLSRSPVGELFYVDWETDETHRKAAMENYQYSSERNIKLVQLPLGAPLKVDLRRDDDSRFIIDYTDDLWAKLEHIVSTIDSMAEQLRAIVSTKSGLQQLVAIEGPPVLTIEDAKPTKKKGKK